MKSKQFGQELRKICKEEAIVMTIGPYGSDHRANSRSGYSANSRCCPVTPQNPKVSLITRQLEEYSWMSGNPTPLMKIGQSILCTGSSTQNTTYPNHNLSKYFTKTTPGPYTIKMSKNGHVGPYINTH